MKTTDILKQSYYALTGGALFIALTALLTIVLARFYVSLDIYPIKYAVFIAVFAMVYCWIMRRHNNRYEGLLLSGIILLAFVIQFWLSAKSTLLAISPVCMMVATFGSNTKYYNIFPNQSKTVSKVFRVTGWIVQVLIWGLTVLYVIAFA